MEAIFTLSRRTMLSGSPWRKALRLRRRSRRAERVTSQAANARETYKAFPRETRRTFLCQKVDENVGSYTKGRGPGREKGEVVERRRYLCEPKRSFVRAWPNGKGPD
ncbi:hypothetical protein MPLSOD_200016 [Mesorhizobium sp. SOD10]|nr:hypothetical protein MPLSOD_200016 [Mesorhizobium sp. SOD10]